MKYQIDIMTTSFFSLKENDLSQYLNIVKLLTYILT